MPTYDYGCKACGTEFEAFHGMTEQPRIACPKCGSGETARLLAGGAGLIFKGSGFYITDYKGGAPKSENGAAAKSEASPASADKPASSGDSKSAPAKSEPAAAPAPAPAASSPPPAAS